MCVENFGESCLNVELKEIWNNFDGEPHVFLATVAGDQPRVRPVTLIHFRKKLYVTTGSDDAKVKQIEQNNKTEFCLLLEKGERKGTMRAECVAQIVKNKDVKADVFNSISFAKEFWESMHACERILHQIQWTSCRSK